MTPQIAVLEETKQYVVIKIPRWLARHFPLQKKQGPTVEETLKLASEAKRLARENKLPRLTSLRALR